ncbi:dephospho-CoA kinase [Lactobacillus acetotolerans]|jgi:dephospho-CoA kinase|uniref:Dephospho-CoA kinase n=1 Tax=Lactobacillus acetotolerans TaxID=1600 RepID=A0A0D6A2M6_9LACO|nr:dephospho-CoA kinase [Lactobacillus acetotolerans]KRN39955.1 dephospho-coa kinase [Lactobacillus acetotolerans DSM 20749 = JCM 3825]QFG51002.1 dephospho-CoA kinase [Lactobacillus acetotolerans]QGV04889.1 dephospho-CoA kinase [Lactobacillus acetotolerans]QJD73792.1 dephospho-CoA kinase [Lactobacillus acetotolerans]BAQ56929.1 dephospho-CoA kinase [Lactobacillus acetotolerans]
MTFVLGLTGGIATGKSAADAFFKSKEIPVIDSDVIAHNILNVGQPGWKKVKEHFGSAYLNPDQTVNRRKLGQLVFAHPEQLKILNNITHPLVYQEIQKGISYNREHRIPVVVVDVPLLFESSPKKYYDSILVIALPEKLQVERLMKRNNLTKRQALARIHSQMPLSEKVAKADYVVANTGTIEELRDKLELLLKKIERET